MIFTKKWFVLVVLLVEFLIAGKAYATHEMDHRFKVYGVLKDDAGAPVKDGKVLIVVARVDEGTTVFTDSSGYFETTLHLHDDNLGDDILVSAMGITKKVTAQFVPGDTRTERSVEVNFGVEPSAAGKETDSGTNNYILYGIIGVVIVAGVFFLVSKGGDDDKQKVKAKKK